MSELDVDRLAEALHDAMCDVSHHDRMHRCSRWARYPLIAESTARRYRERRCGTCGANGYYAGDNNHPCGQTDGVPWAASR